MHAEFSDSRDCHVALEIEGGSEVCQLDLDLSEGVREEQDVLQLKVLVSYTPCVEQLERTRELDHDLGDLRVREGVIPVVEEGPHRAVLHSDDGVVLQLLVLEEPDDRFPLDETEGAADSVLDVLDDDIELLLWHVFDEWGNR